MRNLLFVNLIFWIALISSLDAMKITTKLSAEDKLKLLVNDPEFKDYQNFKQNYKRNSDSTPEETLDRFKHYNERKKAFEVENAKRGGHMSKLAVNEFTDWHASEIQSKLLTATPPILSMIPPKHVKYTKSKIAPQTPQEVAEYNALLYNEYQANSKSQPINSKEKDNVMKNMNPKNNPLSLLQTKTKQDWDFSELTASWDNITYVGSSYLLTEIERQGNCGACWAFGTAGMIESYYAKQKSTTFAKLSRQELIDCVTLFTGLSGSCNGGSIAYAVYFLFLQSLAKDSLYPYETKQNTLCKFVTNPSILTGAVSSPFTDFVVHESVTPDELYIMLTNGPVAINIDSSSLDFIYYSSGIFQATCSSSSNHVILLVGYAKGNDGVEYWIAKNSWGSGWGNQGYIKILKSDVYNGCNMYSNVVELI